MSEIMRVVYVRSATNEVVGEGRLVRLAKHVNGDVAIVDKDEGARLRVRRVVLNADGEAEAEDTVRVWNLADVTEPFASPNDQPGVAQDGRPRGEPCAVAEHRKMNGQLSHPGGGPFRWRWEAATRTVTETVDPRPLLRFSTTQVKESKRGGTVNLTVTHVSNPAFTGSLVVDADDQRPLTLAFVGGVATLPIALSRARRGRIESSASARVEAPLEFMITDTEL